MNEQFNEEKKKIADELQGELIKRLLAVEREEEDIQGNAIYLGVAETNMELEEGAGYDNCIYVGAEVNEWHRAEIPGKVVTVSAAKLCNLLCSIVKPIVEKYNWKLYWVSW